MGALKGRQQPVQGRAFKAKAIQGDGCEVNKSANDGEGVAERVRGESVESDQIPNVNQHGHSH